MQRTVDGPDRDYLELAEMANYLRMSPRTIKRLVDDGEFPRPLEMSAGVRVWSWRDALFWVLRVETRQRLRAKKSASQTRATDGQPRANRCQPRDGTA